MRSVIFNKETNEKELLENLSKSIKIEEGYVTSNCLLKAISGNLFIKQLNMNKIRSLYKGDYLSLFKEYYEIIKKIVRVNQIIGLIEVNGEIYEFSKILNKDSLLDDANDFEWEDIKKLFDHILKFINNCVKYNNETNNIIGFEPAIWNFTIDGILFDLDPPKILRKHEDSSFTRKEDENHVKRTIYRSFDEIGMKTNLLVTLLLGEKHNSFIIKNKSETYIDELIEKIINSFTDKNKSIIFKDKLYNGLKFEEKFIDHPIELLRREYKMREQLKEKEIIFVGGTSESGKSGGINYIIDNYSKVQHIKIRDVFPKIYEDTLTNLSFEEWQDREEKRDLNNFWRLFINKLGEMVQDDKKIIILDTMYGVNGMIELYQILGKKVHLLYIDAPFEDRVMREYKRLRTDSPRGTRKADLTITLEDVEKRTLKKDAKKNKLGADKLPFLSYNYENLNEIEINPNGEKFTDIIINDGTLAEFYCNLDKYINKILSKNHFNKKVRKIR